MKLAQLFILIVAFFMLGTAKAGLLVEPLIGYNVNYKFQTDDASEDKGSGLGYGGRLGYQNLGFQLGLDYLKSSIGPDSNDYKKDLSTSEWAGFVGFEFPILLRVYAGYIFAATGETEYDDGTNKGDLELSDGSGMKFGIGFTGLPFVDINVEYRKGTFGEYKFGGAKVDKDTDYSSLLLSLSLPFVI
jgi:hypothetical protein